MKLLLSIFALFLCNVHWAQYSRSEANEHFQNLNFKEAITIYHHLESEKKRSRPLFVERLAESYFNINDYTNAKIWYQKLYELKDKRVGEAIFIKYVQSLKAGQEYEAANSLIKEYYDYDQQKLATILEQEKYLDSLMAQNPGYQISNMEINSPFSDFAPMYYKDALVFSSSRTPMLSEDAMYSWNNQPYLSILTAKRDKSTGELSDVQKFHNNIQSSFHEGTLTYSSDFKTVYFTQNYINNHSLVVNPKGFSNMQILRGEVVGDSIVHLKALKFNNPKYSYGHPYLTKDGKRLFFVSDMFGGFGETDIYYVDIDKDGDLGPAVNLGPTINTAGREMFPYTSGQYLYFASDSHFGLGGLDIFKSEIEPANSYGIPKNMGSPINSNMDDFALIINDQNNSGYFSSNRVNGKGDDDIYRFLEIAEMMPYKGNIINEITKAPLPNVIVKVYDQANKLITETFTDEEGNFEALISPTLNHIFAFLKPEYKQELKTVNNADTPELYKDLNNIELTPFSSFVTNEGGVEKVRINPIFFNLNRYNITYKAAKELDKIVSFMNAFPSVKIKIEAHTDSRASTAINMELSNNRATSTQNYLIEKGINASRIVSAKGYGESRLINECANGIPCSNGQHLANRRCNFIIISK
ncbi:Peptidoglycan-associated lipoprotein [Arenibacter antarcticus]|uniref:OmpA family protein n=1 Tax=Arenibacter antarcticus TaxID=2040469 RepID=A0ABW5VHX0_9FLAO|nr:OmpA family protein [Arenibacter sp. H213]MCM4168172.1 flagellar motor protein MotB [Arenibacter sp. H213]